MNHTPAPKLLSLFIIATLALTACKKDIETMAQNALYPTKIANKIQAPATPPAKYEQTLLQIKSVKETSSIHLWSYTNQQDSQAPVIVFFHGNGENIGTLFKAKFLEKLESLGCHFVVFDYPGYGKSSGVPSQESLVASAESVLQWTKEKFRQSNVHLLARSLGTGVAIQLAALHQNSTEIRSLILTSAFKDTLSLARHHFPRLYDQVPLKWLEKNSWLSEKAAEQIHIPTLLLHGTKDKKIPFQFGKELFLHFPEMTSSFLAYQGLAHENLFSSQQYWDDISQFLWSY